MTFVLIPNPSYHKLLDLNIEWRYQNKRLVLTTPQNQRIIFKLENVGTLNPKLQGVPDFYNKNKLNYYLDIRESSQGSEDWKNFTNMMEEIRLSLATFLFTHINNFDNLPRNLAMLQDPTITKKALDNNDILWLRSSSPILVKSKDQQFFCGLPVERNDLVHVYFEIEGAYFKENSCRFRLAPLKIEVVEREGYQDPVMSFLDSDQATEIDYNR